MGRLPTADQTGLPAHAVSSANSAVKRAFNGEDTDRARRKRKYTTFTPEDRAKVGKYAAQNEVKKAQKNFRKLNLSESTVCYFKKAYLAEVSKRAKTGDATGDIAVSKSRNVDARLRWENYWILRSTQN